jgi:hypothetical protein
MTMPLIIASSPRVRPLLGLLAMSALISLVSPAGAETTDIPGGTHVLPVSGLELELPMAAEGRSYRISSSFALNENGYDGRDVIDDVVDGVLVGGTWISVGYFDAGGPAEVVASVSLTNDWTAQHDAWGTTWSVHGGTFTFDGELGAQPTLVACAALGKGKSLLIHRFFLSEQLTMTQAAMCDGFAQSTVAQAAWLAYAGGRTGLVMPTRRPECRSRGSIAPVRYEVLGNTLLELRIPDDGFVWMVRSDPSEMVDHLDLMAPAFPEVTIEVVILEGDDCASALSVIELEKRDVAPVNLPAGWTAGPQLVVGEDLELTACHPLIDGMLVVGIFQGPQETDVAYLAPMLEALAEAAAGW